MADHTVIFGAGIIGTATAFYVSQLPHASQIHLVEASSELFASASGKAGGFLAEDWFDHVTAELGELSFRLHRELADEHDGRRRWGYSHSTFYIAGLNSASISLPNLPSDAKIEQAAVEQLLYVAEQMIGSDVEIVRDELCFRPVTQTGAPILSKIADGKLGGGAATAASGGVFVCAGHGPWGISLGLGTGKVLSEMLQRRKLSCDVSGLALG